MRSSSSSNRLRQTSYGNQITNQTAGLCRHQHNGEFET